MSTPLRTVVALVALVAVCGANAPAATTGRLSPELQKAVDAYEKRKKREAAKKTKEIEKEAKETVKDVMKKGEEAFREKRYAAAYLYFSCVAAAGPKGDTATVAKARAKMTEIEAMANARLEQARVLMLRRRSTEAADALLQVVEEFGYCPAAKEARKLLSQLKGTPSVAASLRYSDGKAEEDAENYAEALRIYDEVDRRWPDEIAALRARMAAKKIRGDPEKMAVTREITEADAERNCPTLLNMAKSFLMNMEAAASPEAGEPDAAAELKCQALEKLQQVVREYPGTVYARRAAEVVEALSSGQATEARDLLDDPLPEGR